MFNLFNRISTFLSIIIGFLVTLFLAIFVDEVDFDNDTFLVWGIFTAIFGLISKKLFFSRNFILNSLRKKEKSVLQDEEIFVKTKKEQQN
jgi:ABC-type bacteriocin/lantibiotic exporter with double-glycine peptidase domain